MKHVYLVYPFADDAETAHCAAKRLPLCGRVIAEDDDGPIHAAYMAHIAAGLPLAGEADADAE